jgi:hypothetical protein
MTPPVASGTLPRTVAPRAPRRVSGPAARRNRTHPPEDARRAAPPRRAAAPDPFVLRAINRTLALSDSRFLDRLIRGRLWIPIVAAGLMGIVFMQVSMLKLNAGIGRAVQSAGTLERQNSTLRADVSRMESGSKIDAVAKDLGMVAPAATTSPSYVTASTAVAAAAARRMTAADPDAILRSKQATALANGQSVAGLTTSGTGTTTAGTAMTAATTPQTASTGTAAGATTTAAAPQQTTPAPQQTAAAPQQTTAATTGTAAPPQQTAAAPTGAATGAVTPPSPQGTTASTTAGGAVAPAAG